MFDLTPCAVLMIVGIPYVIVQRKSYNSRIPISKLFISKLVCVISLLSCKLRMYTNLFLGFLPYSVPFGMD